MTKKHEHKKYATKEDLKEELYKVHRRLDDRYIKEDVQILVVIGICISIAVILFVMALASTYSNPNLAGLTVDCPEEIKTEIITIDEYFYSEDYPLDYDITCEADGILNRYDSLGRQTIYGFSHAYGTVCIIKWEEDADCTIRKHD